MQNGCPLLKDAVEYLESMETKSVEVIANAEQVVTFDTPRQLTSVLFVNADGAEEGMDTYDITTSGFKCKAGSAGTVYYKTDEVSA